MKVTPSGQFYNSISIGLHPGWGPGTPAGEIWAHIDNWQPCGDELGAMRARVGGLNARAVGTMKPFFDRGGKVIAMPLEDWAGKPLDDAAWTATVDGLQFLKTNNLIPHLIALEGINEYDLRSGRSDWAPQLRAWVKRFHDHVRADHAFDGLPIIAPSIGGRMEMQRFKDLGDLSPWVDKANAHNYPLSRLVSDMLKIADPEAAVQAPGKGKWTTECGTKVAGPWHGVDAYWVDERTQAKLLTRMVVDLFAGGWELNSVYELLDDNTQFGLVRPTKNADGTWAIHKRPSFYALKNLIELVRDTADGPTNVQAPVLSGCNSATRSQLLTKSDGTSLLLLHQNVRSWPTVAPFKGVDAAPLNVKVSGLPKTAKCRIFRPTFGSAPVGSASGSTITVPVRDEVTIVEIA